MSPPYWPEVSTRLRFRCTRPKGELLGTRQGPTSANSVSSLQIGPGNLADRAAEFCGIIEIDRVDGANRARANGFRRDPRMQSRQRKNRQLGACIAAIQIFRGVCFGVSSRLCFFQRLTEREFAHSRSGSGCSCRFHSECQQMPCRRSPHSPVRRAGSTGTPPATEAPNSSWHAMSRGKVQKIGPVPRDELLVRRHDRLARFKRAAHDLLGWIEAADEFDDDVDVGFEHGIHVFGPNHMARNPILFLLVRRCDCRCG